MLRVSNIHASFGDNHVLRGVNFRLEPSGISGLIGPSGGGKSVLLKILGGVRPAQRGDVEWCGLGTSDVSLMFQEGALFDSLSVFDNVAFPLVGGKVPFDGLPQAVRREVKPKVEEMLARVGLTRAAFKIPAQLSGGMRRRVSLARALVNRPKVALLDDPTCGLDPVASSVIMELILELHREYQPTMVLVSHDLRRLLPNVSRILALFDGRIEFDGPLENIAAEGGGVVRRFVECRFDLNGSQA